MTTYNTNCFDKNGVEIAVGDIVRFIDDYGECKDYTVHFGRGTFDAGYYSYIGYFLVDDNGEQAEDAAMFGLEGTMSLIDRWKSVEIISIYEERQRETAGDPHKDLF